MTTTTNDRQTSERERLAEVCEQSGQLHLVEIAKQLRADGAEIAQLRAAAARQTDGRTKLAEVLSQLAEIEQLKAELAALRAENEALRTAAADAAVAAEAALLVTLQSFIRSKENRRG